MFIINKEIFANDRLITVRELAEKTKLSISMVYKQVALGRLNAVRIGRTYRFKPKDVEKFLMEMAK